jgi:leucine dehydrogenase
MQAQRITGFSVERSARGRYKRRGAEASMKVFDTLRSLDYGELHLGHDSHTGLRAIIALHSTRLGPAIGGCRVRAYADEADAIDDVTRLGRAMTYKAALARLPHGGGKAVILAPDDLASWEPARRADLFHAFARFVHGLGGRYLTSEDSGTGAGDMDVIRSVTPHVLGASTDRGGSGDPSSATALGVRRGIEAIAVERLGRGDLRGLHVAVQGVGHVGAHLARELAQAGAQLTISDVDPARGHAIATELGATIVDPTRILEVECDVLAPCALGGALTDDVIERLRTRVIAGAANNQLRTPSVGRALHTRGIFYAPDYAINAGGLINVAQEFAGYDRERARAKTLAIFDTICEISARSRTEDAPPEVIADRMAEEIIAAGPHATAG